MVKIMKERKEKEILEFLQSKEFATVEQIAKSLYLSESTVRRKLNVLQNQGLVTRTHGGAKINDRNNVLPGFTFRFHKNIIEKKKMAKVGASLIKDGDVIFIDGSTSAFYVATFLKGLKNISVITNGIDTLSELAKTDIKTYSTGGAISKTNNSVLVGYQVENTINNFYADIMFFSTSAISSNGKIYDCYEEETSMRKTMIANSRIKVLLLDSTKFTATSPYTICSVDDIDYLITDKDVSNYFVVKPKCKIIVVK